MEEGAEEEGALVTYNIAFFVYTCAQDFMDSTIRKKFYFPCGARLGRFKDPFFSSW